MASLWLTVAVLLALCQASTPARAPQPLSTTTKASTAARQTAPQETRPTASTAARQTTPQETRPTASTPVRQTVPQETRPTASTAARQTAPQETRPTASTPVRQTVPQETRPTASTVKRYARALDDVDTESSELPSLKCYQCVDISEQPNCSSPEEVECRPGLTRCLNMMLTPPAYGITRRCASERECQSLESNPSSFVTARCCDTDLCN
ncbi:testis-specific H1 histone-like isoform X4 [Lepisosteus oculatus]|uniref:testis-specific H1 histone-like isoform X2 n=1 Tax=Lepisosteus oculatus TaxID=7918 RepID=UPI003722573B